MTGEKGLTYEEFLLVGLLLNGHLMKIADDDDNGDSL